MIGCHFQNQNAHHSILQQLNLLKLVFFRNSAPACVFILFGVSCSYHVFILAFNNYRIIRTYIPEAQEGIDSSILEDDSSNLATENLDKNLEV